MKLKGKRKRKRNKERKKQEYNEREREPSLSGKSKNKEEKGKKSMIVCHEEVRKVLLAKREPLRLKTSLREFQNVFSKDVPHRLPPLRGTKHHMDLTLRATLPNRVAYRTNPRKAKEI
ncbi:hypothetical protein CR513_03039, partial [Mucuna pruriens]